MTKSQWNALKRMTESKYNHNFFSSTLSIGVVTLKMVKFGPTLIGSTLIGFELEYPSYSVSLYKDKPIPSHDKLYLRYLYNEWMSVMSI